MAWITWLGLVRGLACHRLANPLDHMLGSHGLRCAGFCTSKRDGVADGRHSGLSLTTEDWRLETEDLGLISLFIPEDETVCGHQHHVACGPPWQRKLAGRGGGVRCTAVATPGCPSTHTPEFQQLPLLHNCVIICTTLHEPTRANGFAHH